MLEGKKMKLDYKKILKFLFPEYQIIEIWRKYGFFVRSRPSRTNEAVTTVHRSAISYTGLPQEGDAQSEADQATRANWDSYDSMKQGMVLRDRGTLSYENANKSGDIIERFASIRSELSRKMIGQNAYLDQLCIAFKRPYIVGLEPGKPLNTIFIMGPVGSGRHMSVRLIVSEMYKQKLLVVGSIVSVNLAKYETEDARPLFLADLYNALCHSAEVIVFDHFDRCHAAFLHLLAELSICGKISLPVRYAMQNEMLIEATGALIRDSIGEIGVNEKYLVFITDKNQKSIFEICGAKFAAEISDIIEMDTYSTDEIQVICALSFERFKKKCERQLGFDVRAENSALQLCSVRFKRQTGMHAIENYWEEVYKAFAEYKLRENAAPNLSVGLYAQSDELFGVFDGKTYNLMELLPKKLDSGIEEIKAELEQVIGLRKVKEYVLALEENLKVQRMRAQSGRKMASVSRHMVFTGNPGTGKTMIARIVARYLKALGALSSGQLREVSRADLVGQYVGQTARLTSDVIQSALGGVLLIDEAYSLCRGKQDSFGLEAIDALVKGIEDCREDLVVILAGYKEEMDAFFQTNPGLKSRFPNIIEFEDYTPVEMFEIALLTAKSKGYFIANACREGLLRLFEKSQIRGRNDSGNGRLVRNVVEGAILKQSARLLKDPTVSMDLLTPEDFALGRASAFDLEAKLAEIVGLDEVKEFIRGQYKLLIAQEKRRKAGIKIDVAQSLHMVFTGNPGTGKTTVARVIAQMFRHMGLLKSGHLVETDRSGLVAEYVGQTAKKTEDIFRSALGGVLFIDEAYALADQGGFGKEAVDTLVKLIEDYHGELVVILAGYRKEMADFMKSNSGLASRFPLRIVFRDYTVDELTAIALRIIAAKGFSIDEAARQALAQEMEKLHARSDPSSGNGRMARNFVEEIMRKQSGRIAQAEVSHAELAAIHEQDVRREQSVQAAFDLEAELRQVIGLEEVKAFIRGLYARLRLQGERKKQGLPIDSSQTLHMIFKGNPGTGKTMIARTVAKILYEIGMLPAMKLVETDRSGLVAGYVGQTAIKTTEKVMEALDGVLFIDEAYALAGGGGNDFGREAIDTLVKLMDDNRERLVVILAGYSRDMEQFLTVNEGLRSRFPHQIEFVDYTADELLTIADQFYNGKGYWLTAEARKKLRGIFDAARCENAFGNGRYVRNLFEKSVNLQALRLSSDDSLTKEELMTIEAADIERV